MIRSIVVLVVLVHLSCGEAGSVLELEGAPVTLSEWSLCEDEVLLPVVPSRNGRHTCKLQPMIMALRERDIKDYFNEDLTLRTRLTTQRYQTI